MNEQNNIQQTSWQRSSRKTILSAIGIALGIAAISFIVLAVLPASEEPFFKASLKSVLLGLGLLGVACPLCIAGLILKKRSAKSPYFEEAFIATVINIFGFILLSLGLVCIGLSVYALVRRLLGSE